MTEAAPTAKIVARAIAAVVVVAIMLFLVDLLAGPFFSLSTRTWDPEVRGTAVVGGIEGRIKGTDAMTGTVRIASGLLGLESLPVIVMAQTRIAVGGKLGAFADLERGQLVRIAYEVFPDRLVARRVDVLGGQRHDVSSPAVEDTEASSTAAPAVAAPPASEPAVPQWTAVPTAPPASLSSASQPAPEPRPSPAARPRTGKSRAAAAPRTASPQRPPIVEELRPASIPASTASSVPVAAEAKRSEPAPLYAPPAVPPPPLPAPPAKPAPRRTPSDDGIAVIEWLLRHPQSP